MAAPAWFTGQNMMRITGAAYILNGLMACFFGEFFMEQSFGAWVDDPEANELGLYLLDAMGCIIIGFMPSSIMARTGDVPRTACQLPSRGPGPAARIASALAPACGCDRPRTAISGKMCIRYM